MTIAEGIHFKLVHHICVLNMRNILLIYRVENDIVAAHIGEF